MAKNAGSQMLKVGWAQDGKHGYLEIQAGTLAYLGIDASQVVVNEISFTVPEKPITRQLYPGGPSLSYTRKAQTIRRLEGGRVSTAKSANVMYLVGEKGNRDTLRITGNPRLFAKWLKGHVSNMQGSGAVILKGRCGTEYAVLRAPTAGGIFGTGIVPTAA